MIIIGGDGTIHHVLNFYMNLIDNSGKEMENVYFAAIAGGEKSFAFLG